MKDIIAAFQIEPGEWVAFTGNPRGDQARLLWDDLNRWELDKAAPDNPISLSGGIPVVNMMLLNSKALDQLWAKYGDFIETYGRYWIDASGRPDGHLEAPAVRILLEDDDFVPNACAPGRGSTLQECSGGTVGSGYHDPIRGPTHLQRTGLPMARRPRRDAAEIWLRCHVDVWVPRRETARSSKWAPVPTWCGSPR